MVNSNALLQLQGVGSGGWVSNYAADNNLCLVYPHVPVEMINFAIKSTLFANCRKINDRQQVHRPINITVIKGRIISHSGDDKFGYLPLAEGGEESQSVLLLPSGRRCNGEQE